LVHPGSGLVYLYYEFGQVFGDDQPFYALQDPSLGGEREPYENIEDYAKEYIQAIRTVQPSGPYRIGGWSFGGHVAFEMAHQLHDIGEEVELLFVLDSEAAPAARKVKLSDRLVYWKKRIVEFGRTLLDVMPYIRDAGYLIFTRKKMGENHPSNQMSRLEYIQWGLTDAAYKRFARRAGIAEIISQDASLLRMRLPTLRRTLYVLRRHFEVIPRYRPRVYTGRMILLRAEEQIRRNFPLDATLGWGDLVNGEVIVHQVPGNHATMLKQPNLQVLIGTIQKYIQEFDGSEEF